jgi:hypothetical protein
MLRRRTPLAAGLAIAVLVVGAPAAGATTSTPTGGLALPGNAPGPCASISNEAQGSTGGTAASVCQGSGLSFVGPAVGQVATIMGPTIISPGFVGTVILSAGNVAVGP